MHAKVSDCMFEIYAILFVNNTLISMEKSKIQTKKSKGKLVDYQQNTEN